MPATVAFTMSILFVSFFAVIAYWIHARQRRSRELLEARMQLQGRILERFDSQAEFAGFLGSEGGRRFLGQLSDERGWRPAKRILGAVSVGIVVSFVGLGLWVLSGVVGEREILYPGIVLLFLGAGFLVAAGASYWMSRSWGLLPGQRETSLDELGQG